MRDHDIKAHMERAIATLQTIQNNYPIDDPDIDITLNQTLDFLRWERFKVINNIFKKTSSSPGWCRKVI